MTFGVAGILELALVLGAAPPELTRSVDTLFEDLALSERPGFDADEDVALFVRAAPGEGRAELERVLRGLALAALERRQQASIVLLDSDEEAPRTVGRRLGAEWLFQIRAERNGPDALTLRAELRSIDRGLWAPIRAEDPIHAFATSRARWSPPATAPSPVIEERRTLTRLRVVNDRVLALAACELDGDPAPELVVLSRASLIVLDGARRDAATLASFGLRALPLAPRRAREPIGKVVCTRENARAALAFGTSDLQKGYVLSVEERGTRLTVARELDGVPVASQKHQLVLARVVDNRWRLPDGQSLLDIGTRVGVDASHRVVPLSSSPSRSLPGPLTSGLGARSFSIADRVFLATTSSKSFDREDVIQIIDPDTRQGVGAAVRIPRPVQASVWLPGDTPYAQLALAARGPLDAATDLYLLEWSP